MPFDGHFLPMTGVAQRLAELGHDVRFYTGSSFADRLATLGVPHEPFRRALEINGENMAEHFPDIAKLKGPKRIAFDVEKIFFANIPAHYADILELHREWAFDLLVNDAAFFAAYPVTRKLGAFKTSMLQDVEANKPLEIDALVGAVRELGQITSTPTPHTDALLGLVRLMARTRGLY